MLRVTLKGSDKKDTAACAAVLAEARILGEKSASVQGTTMRVTVFNQKGDVGKTTTMINLGAALARQNKPALLIDLDSQNEHTLKALEPVLKRPMERRYVLTRYDRWRKMSSEILDRVRRQFGSGVASQ